MLNPGEIVLITTGSFFILFGIFVTILNIRIGQMARSTFLSSNVTKMKKMMNKAKAETRRSMLSPIELVVIACEAGMTIDEIRSEYLKEHIPHQVILQSIFGNLDNAFLSRLKDNGHFMDTGYAHEKLFFEMKENVIDSLILCATQRYTEEDNLIQKTQFDNYKKQKYSEKIIQNFSSSQKTPQNCTIRKGEKSIKNKQLSSL